MAADFAKTLKLLLDFFRQNGLDLEKFHELGGP
jgi:hypothetical protein